MSDTPCLERDLHPHPGDEIVKFRVSFDVEISQDTAEEMTYEQDMIDEFKEEPVETTIEVMEQDLQNTDFCWSIGIVKIDCFDK